MQVRVILVRTPKAARSTAYFMATGALLAVGMSFVLVAWLNTWNKDEVFQYSILPRLDISVAEQLVPGMLVKAKWGGKLHDAEVLACAGEFEKKLILCCLAQYVGPIWLPCV